FATGVAEVRNSIFNVNTPFSGANTQAVAFLFSDVTYSNTLQSPLLGGISYTNQQLLNPRPQAGSPALTDVLPQAPTLTAVNYRGAFAPQDHWADGWTALSQMGFLSDGRTIVNVTSDITGNQTWYETNIYILQSVIYVQTNSTLTIEPGTIIKGATNALTLQ